MAVFSDHDVCVRPRPSLLALGMAAPLLRFPLIGCTSLKFDHGLVA
jgi:hypothetical protein